MPRFSCALASAAKKREQEVGAGASRHKVPRAGDVVITEGPRPSAQPSGRSPTTAPVQVCLYKVTDTAGDVWEAYQEQEEPLWQVQIDHAVQSPITFQMRDSFNDFLRTAKAGDERMPANVRELEDAVGVRLVVSDKTDPDDAGFVQWRVGFYVAGDLNNFLMLLDDWFVYKAKATTGEQPFQVHLYPHIGVEVTNVEDFAYDHIELNEPSPVLPLGIFQCQPCIGKSIVTLNLQIEADTMNIVITGNTWSFRSRMNTFGVWGGYQEASTIDQKRPYLRVLKGLDLSDDEQKERVLSMIGGSVFHNLAMRVRIDPGDKPLQPDC